MNDDLIDDVDWSAEKGIADPEKIAITEGSYGDHAALGGLTFTPKGFACGADIVGHSNLIMLLETIPPYWKPVLEQVTKREALRTGSPFTLLLSRFWQSI